MKWRRIGLGKKTSVPPNRAHNYFVSQSLLAFCPNTESDTKIQILCKITDILTNLTTIMINGIQKLN